MFRSHAVIRLHRINKTVLLAALLACTCFKSNTLIVADQEVLFFMGIIRPLMQSICFILKQQIHRWPATGSTLAQKISIGRLSAQVIQLLSTSILQLSMPMFRMLWQLLLTTRKRMFACASSRLFFCQRTGCPSLSMGSGFQSFPHRADDQIGSASGYFWQ